jgi:hypothetical protein
MAKLLLGAIDEVARAIVREVPTWVGRYRGWCAAVAVVPVLWAANRRRALPSPRRSRGALTMGIVPGRLVGGPLDGCKTSPGARLQYVWCHESPPKDGEPRARVYGAAGPGRYLYRTIGHVDGDEVWLYSGHTHAVCECGGFNQVGGSLTPRCALCDAPLHRPSDHPVG